VRKPKTTKNTSGLRRGGGRPKGAPNKATLEAKTLCRQLVEDEQYQQRFRRRLLSGRLPPRLEELVWHYAFGRPTYTVAADGGIDGLAALLAKKYDEAVGMAAQHPTTKA
jgi:hypothetical protein